MQWPTQDEGPHCAIEEPSGRHSCAEKDGVPFPARPLAGVGTGHWPLGGGSQQVQVPMVWRGVRSVSLAGEKDQFRSLSLV